MQCRSSDLLRLFSRACWAPVVNVSEPAGHSRHLVPGGSAGSAFAQDLDGPGDPALPRLVGLGALDLEGMPGLVAVRERVERSPGGGLRVEGGREIGRDAHFARRRIELDIDVDLIAAGDAG